MKQSHNILSDDSSLITTLFGHLQTTLPPGANVLIALSGGVDSSVVSALLQHYHREGNLNRAPIAVTTDSPSTPRRQLTMAITVARFLKIEHRVIQGTEQADVRYRSNGPDRCFHCKTHLYSALRAIAAFRPGSLLMSGTNADDLGDYRPGIQAGHEFDVATPLADVGLDKSAVRRLARHYRLPNADAPAAPCLASRIVYGVEVTPERLAMVERAETLLLELGFDICRVRLNTRNGQIVGRVEVPENQLADLEAIWSSEGLPRQLAGIGFAKVEIEADGFRSGRLNDAIQPKPQTRSLRNHADLPILDSRMAT